MKRLFLSFILSLFFVFPAYSAVSDYAGVYSGTISGDDQGPWIAVIASNGYAKMLFYSNVYQEMDGSEGYYISSNGKLIATTVNTSAVISASFSVAGSVTGTWAAGLYASGTISGTKQTNTAKYAGTYKGTLSGIDTGTWTMNISSAGIITGSGNSSHDGPFTIDGAVNNAGMMMAAADESSGYGNISGNTLSGKWYDEGSYIGGTFSGTRQTQTQPNLTPYKPSKWSDKIVLSTLKGTNIDAAAIDKSDTIYLDWAVINDGLADAGLYTVSLILDGKQKETWTGQTKVNYYTYFEDYSLGSLSAGNHTVRITADSAKVITESNEADNVYSRTFAVSGGTVINHTYYLPIFKPAPGYWSGLGVTNLSSTDTANLVITIYDKAGTVQDTQTATIVKKGQASLMVGKTLTDDGWVKIGSDQALAGLNFLGRYKGTTKNYYLADVPFCDSLSTLLLIPHVAQNEMFDTVLCLANPNTSTATVTYTYTSKNGTASTPYVSTIPANGSKEISVAVIAGSTNISGGYITISSSKGLAAFALYHNLKTGNYSYAGINAVDISK